MKERPSGFHFLAGKEQNMYKLLIADDARISREGLKKTISWENFGITVVGLAKDGFEAYEMIRLHAPDIVISDIRMPGLNGIELLEKSRKLFPGIVFILLSAYGEFEYAQPAMELGVKYYLLKPCPQAKLEKILKDITAELSARAASSPDKGTPLLAAASGTPSGASLIKQVLTYVDAHYQDSNLSLKYIAAHITYTNPDYLGRLFKTHAGQKFSDYLMTKRLEYAKSLIISNADLKVYEICQLCGYGNNTEYFSQLFKKYTGVSPYDYKKKGPS